MPGASGRRSPRARRARKPLPTRQARRLASLTASLILLAADHEDLVRLAVLRGWALTGCQLDAVRGELIKIAHRLAKKSQPRTG